MSAVKLSATESRDDERELWIKYIAVSTKAASTAAFRTVSIFTAMVRVRIDSCG